MRQHSNLNIGTRVPAASELRRQLIASASPAGFDVRRASLGFRTRKSTWDFIRGCSRRLLGTPGHLARRLLYKSRRRVRRMQDALIRHARPQRQPLQAPSPGAAIAKVSSRLGLIALESRIVFDAAAVATAEQLANEVAQQQAAEVVDAMKDAAATEADALQDLLDYAIAVDAGGASNEIAFVDGSVANAGEFIASFGPNIEVIVLEPSRDGVEQIAEVLSGRSGVDAIHIVSHGSAGELILGSTRLNSASIEGAHADELVVIRDALSERADILIYGCNFGTGDNGQLAVELLANLTGADVAASDDLTGASAKGGDWELERQTGAIEAGVVEAMKWNGVLDPFSISATTAPVVRDNTGAVVAASSTSIGGVVANRHITDVNKMVGATVIWANAGFVGGTPIDLRATVLSVADTNPNVGHDPGLHFTISNGDDPSVRIDNAEVRIRWDAFEAGTYDPVTGTGVVAQGDVGFFIRDIDAQGHLYSAPGVMTFFNLSGIKPQESVRADFDQLANYQTESLALTHLTVGLNIDPDTGATITDPAHPSYGKITATNLVDTELAEAKSGVKFNWNAVGRLGSYVSRRPTARHSQF